MIGLPRDGLRKSAYAVGEYPRKGKGITPDAAVAEGKKAGMTNAALEHVVRNRIVELQKQ